MNITLSASCIRVFGALVLVIAATLNPIAALAQAWPAKPIKLVAVFPPGGSVDQVARILSVPLQQALGQPVIVENKGGASGSIGTAAVVRRTPMATPSRWCLIPMRSTPA